MNVLSRDELIRARRGFVREWRLHALSIISLAVAFVCLGSALVLVTNMDALRTKWASTGRVSVYLKDGALPEEVEALTRTLKELPLVTGVRHMTSADAQSEFLSSTNDDAERVRMSALPAEAFPPSLEVDMQSGVAPADITLLVDKMRKLRIVEDVETYANWTERLSRVISGGVMASLVLALVVMVAVFAVVGATTRLVLQRRKTEVEVLKLVGASPAYLRRPYVLEGLAQGALGAFASIIILGVLYALVRVRMSSEASLLLGIEPRFLHLGTCLSLVALGALVGAMAARVGLRRLVNA